MSKNIKLIIIISISLFFIQNCKTPELEYEWFTFEAEGWYSSNTDTSYLKLISSIKINQSSVNINPANTSDSRHFQPASITGWVYRVYSGENLLFEITEYNVNVIFEDIFLSVGEEQVSYLWVTIESRSPLNGDVFNGLNPDRVEIEIEIQDNDGNTFHTENSFPFVFDRN